MLKLQDVTIARGAKVLIKQIDLAIFEKMTVGIVGANGCGKSSLFAAIRKQLDIAHGDLYLKKDLVISSLEQETAAVDTTAVNYTISGDLILFQILNQLEQAEQSENFDVMMQCHDRLAEVDGYSAQARAAKILVHLGFSQEDIHRPVSDFSGGWRMRINLAKCLFASSDLLLLDEPTNHLDVPAIVWLEKFLNRYQGGILMISHDRDFLDNTVSHIAHIERRELQLYTGNYSVFEVLRAQQIALQQSRHKKQQAQISHAKKFVDRFRSTASKAKQAQSRLKTLKKMDHVQLIYAQLPFKFRFMEPKSTPDPMLTIRKVDLGYQDTVIIKQVRISLLSGQRIGLLGANGAGKSTLIKALCGEIAPLSGVIERPSSVVIGYFAQHQVDHLPLDRSPLSLLQDLDRNETEKQFIRYLGSFGFSRDQSLSPLQNFSGGEKARMALALIVWRKPNLLLLDEPTNHLDMQMREALMLALQDYVGAMILVSHDRHLMRTLVDELYLIEDGQLKSYSGSLEDYQTSYAA
ncbi:MAG: ATP-binding cassette domain-containing protein [Gammaproteobacteria bacterium]